VSVTRPLRTRLEDGQLEREPVGAADR